MKKKKCLFITGVCIGLLAFNAHLSAGKEASDISMENIKRLSLGEGSETQCVGSGSLDCPIFTAKVLYIVRDV